MREMLMRSAGATSDSFDSKSLFWAFAAHHILGVPACLLPRLFPL